MNHKPSRFKLVSATATLALLFLTGLHGRTWTNAEDTKTFEGELESYDEESGKVGVIVGGVTYYFSDNKLSEGDVAWLKSGGKATLDEAAPDISKGDTTTQRADSDGMEADMSKPVQVFILMGELDMHGSGKIQSLEMAVKRKGKYPYLVDDSGEWIERKDVRYVHVMNDEQLNNEWLTVSDEKIGPELGIGHQLGQTIDAPVLILKTCNGNRSLGWDLLPPGSKPYEFRGKTYPGYRGTPKDPEGNGEKVMTEWYAGKQYDDDTEAAKRVLEQLDRYYPGATGYEIAGFFWWQGEKDQREPAHCERYEQNLIQLIKMLRKEFDAPDAKFVTASPGRTRDGFKAADEIIFEALEAVSKSEDPELQGTVGFVDTNPLSADGNRFVHYGGNCETYMNIGEAMGKAMIEQLKK